MVRPDEVALLAHVDTYLYPHCTKGHLIMQTFIGTKIIKAEPEARDGKPGWLVEYADGYQSWSPNKAFEEAYQPLDRMSFGHAIVMLKAGRRVARAGWNGKGQYVYWVPANSYPPTTPAARAAFGGGPVPYNAYLAINTGNGISTWVPSINDVLADDWSVLED